MTPLPVSRSRADAVGKRLANGTASEADWATYGEILDAYGEALDAAQQRLSAAGVKATGRVKSRDTLLDKVRRGTSLKSVQDVAGARIVVPGGLDEQDALTTRLVALFSREAAQPKVVDRRTNPVHGYRAVHVVVTSLSLPVEVQIRTRLQDVWAQFVEALGDQWGRDHRYLGAPADANLPIPGSPWTRGAVFDLCLALSSAIARSEEAAERIRLVHTDTVPADKIADYRALSATVDDSAAKLQETLATLKTIAEGWEGR